MAAWPVPARLLFRIHQNFFQRMFECQRFLFAEPIQQVPVDLVNPCVDLWVERGAFFGQGDIDLATVLQVAHSVDDALGFQSIEKARHWAGLDPGHVAELIDGPCAVEHRTDDHDKLRRGQVQGQHFLIERCKERIPNLADQVAKLRIFQFF